MDQDEELEAQLATEEAELAEKDEQFIKKWSGWAILGPFIPAVFALFIIVTGSTVINTIPEGKQCKMNLDQPLVAAIVNSYMFLMVYSWVFLGDTVTWNVPIIERKVVLMSPFRSLRFLMFYYLILGSLSAIIMLWYSVWYTDANAKFCRTTTPVLYYYSGFVLTIYLLGFLTVVLILVNKKFGADIMNFAAQMLREPTPEEMEEKIFRKKFAEFDKEKVGYISNEEVPQIITELGVYMPDEEMPDLISSLDPKQEGNVKLDDLLQWFKKMNAAAAPDEMAVVTENK